MRGPGASVDMYEVTLAELPSDVQKVFYQVKKIMESCQWNVEGDISSLGTALTTNFGNLFTQNTMGLDSVRQDVSKSREGLSFLMSY